MPFGYKITLSKLTETYRMPPLIKYLVVFTLVFIIYNLFKAFYHLYNKKSDPKEVVKSLAIRVGLSITLFVSLLLASYLGFIQPHSLIPTNQAVEQDINKKGATQ